jgi:PAS domain S-box-containing protein
MSENQISLAIGGDIRSEEQLQLLATIVEQSTESVIITTAELDLPGPQIVYVNPAFTRMTGYSLEEVRGKTPRILQGPKTDRAVLSRLRKDCGAGKNFQGEVINYRKDGSEFYLEWSVVPVWNGSGDIAYFIATQRDITERHRADEQLRKGEEEFRSLFELSAVGMTQVSPEGRYLRVNRKLCQMLGYSEEELLQLTLHEVTHPDDREISAAKLHSSFVGDPDEYSIEKRYIRKDGGIIWVLIKWTIVRDAAGEALHSVANIQDITARKLAEEALRASEAQLRAIIDNSSAFIFVKDLEGRYLRVNRWYENMSGMKESDMVGKTVYELYPQDIADALNSDDQEVISANTPIQFEEQVPFPDGIHHFVAVKFPLYDKNGRPYALCGIATDITERKQIEEALQESEARLELAMEAGDIGIFDWNIRTNEVIWTERSKATSGQPLGTSRGTFDHWRKRIHPDDLVPGEASLQEAFKKKLPHWHRQYRVFRTHSGEQRWVNSESHIFYDWRGEPVRMVGVSIDITERKLAEEALKKSAEEIHDLYNRAPTGYHSLDKDGTFVRINDTELEWLGYTREEVVGKINFKDLLTPRGQDKFLESFPKFMATGMVQDLEFDLIRKDGTILPVLLSATAIKDENGSYLMSRSVVYDITDRRHAETEREHLLARERVARAEAEHAANSIRRLQAVTDSTLGRFVLNDLLREMLGRVRELLETDSASVLLLAEDGQSLVVRAAIGSAEQALGVRVPIGEGISGSIAAQRTALIVEDVSKVEVVDPIILRTARSLIGAPLIAEGRLVGVIHADSAQPRHFTESDMRLLQLAADRIALAIEQTRLYEVEQRARRQAEESNRMKDEFLALVSHELRSPLSAMLGYARLLRFGRLDAQRVKNAVDVIERSGRAQTQLIDDLLDTARIISGKLRLEVGAVDLVAVIEGAVQTIYPAADAKNITIRTDLHSKVGQITGDAERLQQVVWNLLSNAVKFTPAGGSVETRLERIDPHICITVSDTGKGISSDFLPYVFDRFRQADISSSRRYGGLGLGLALVKYLVELHGGTIEAMSAGEGKGATFKVLLPVRAVSWTLGEAEPPPVTTVSAERPALAGVRALVVDDEDDARELLKTVIAQYGADVVAAQSAAEAYALITTMPEEKRPNVILTDLGMPDEDGYSLLRRLREWEHEHGVFIPAVALTAYGRSEDRMRALLAGFQMHVSKPVEPDELAVIVASILRRPDRRRIS